MAGTTARRRRRESRVPPIVGILAYAGLLVVLNVRPGWEHLPLLTPAADSAMELLTLSLILCLLARVLEVVGADPRLRAGATYVIALVNLAVLGSLWSTFPFSFGVEPEAWTTIVRWTLAILAAWDVAVAVRAAVRMVTGHRAPRLAGSRA